MTTLKGLTIIAALLVGGTSLALIGFLAAPQIIARQTSTPQSAPTAQRSRSAVSEIGQPGASVTTAQEAQPIPTPSTGPAQNGSAENLVGLTTSAIVTGLRLYWG